ncbi:oxygen-independent coproporphyrinogen III oxidase [Bacillus ginsengihumi]|uniref:Heme chaperone HemW n=1 Tax=Heyndrickxia ginsengihumi TaxID=363870 RepID=A0A0A6VCB6_9BACI|nr:radical SAM family heme chaperone HemW [Heyndrickxia ginsengihumi]KHD85211.1 coproporphyrinogen III oxidase [Heyndrickxia ginsengihumi]NEY19717.1 oxygen-independent coproporphyrinogen III oxidase [Heyndrickxia ginsengihumi]
MKAAYIHIPFCEHICYYCDFNKFLLNGQPVDEYIDMLLKEMKMKISNAPKTELSTIFVGGGTPTALNEGQLQKLLEGIRAILPYNGEGEFTFEANPGETSEEKLKLLFDYGVNRLSFGVQSFNDRLLEKIGRSHRVKDVFSTLNKAQKVGFENISIDLMFGLPTQTIEDFQETLNIAMSLQLPHYSSYSLIIEPKTIFYHLMNKGKLPLPTEEVEADMYQLLMMEMDKHGLNQYEISNFALPGYESQHNLIYWNNEEYFGFGAGAHGYENGIRVANYGAVKKYINMLKDHALPILEQHVETKSEKMEEEMFLGLRKNEGVSISHFREKFHEDIIKLFASSIQEMERRGLLERHGDFIRLTREGRFLGNEVFEAFLLE